MNKKPTSRSPNTAWLTGWNDGLDTLEAEQSQAVEPVAYLIDWPDEPELGHYFSESATESGRSTPLFTHPAPPATGERAELIAGFRELAKIWTGAEAAVFQKAADMLEADAREIKRLEQCRIDEAETTNKAAQASRDLLTKALNKAQQVAVPVPMSDSQISAAWESIHPSKEYPVTRLGRQFARAIEKHHGIEAKLVTKPDSRPQNCGAGHCSCIECPYTKPDWSAA